MLRIATSRFTAAHSVRPTSWPCNLPSGVPSNVPYTLLTHPTTNSLQVRWATKKSGGSTKNGRTSKPKYLGFKALHSAQVAPGNVIIRQRGTEWHPGTNVGMGRDHTLFALIPGRVVLHYDLQRQRRLVSVDDGSLPALPTRPQMKKRLAESLDLEKYLAMSGEDRLEYVQNKIREIAAEDKKEAKVALGQSLLRNGRRRFDLVDLTLL
ncbi:hypothetical protein PhCBS80983_g01518 [Powellomyces hirtus]|uniref:Large ribosomal subunit protein bL27m n=1 Tax=Powellomyces hirtus TaxID=109895 RepID=A0A507EAJ7_9FUNG|nr:hypothetical protein PhCBS80983_g01518 [Powellomyces hirtus]